MNATSTITRRDALLALGAFGATTALPALAATVPVASEGAAFDAAVADAPWLAPFKGLDDRDPSRTDLRCESLVLTGRWPAGLRGRFYRNGPALFERSGQRYHHWFDGDGMVQQFTFSGGGVSHVGRLVRTSKLAAEREAGRFLYPTFGTGIQSEAPVQGPDSMNVANTNAIEHAGRVLAMWEGGSAYALDPKDLSTDGPVTWKEGFEQVPFSAHPKVDAAGHLWNIGSFGDKIVLWHIDPAGHLVDVQVGESPYPNGMAHDVAITAQYIVLPLPPVKMNYAAIARGATPEQAFDFQRREPLRILVMKKDDIRERRVFELPAQMVFHVGNAFERRDGSIALSFVGAADDEFLIHGAVGLVSGHVVGTPGATMQSAVLDMKTGKVNAETMPGVVEFPRVDPRRIGIA
ncbi:MAG: carotenoid oxygenase family protein, partial [Caldimonas sp.]